MPNFDIVIEKAPKKPEKETAKKEEVKKTNSKTEKPK